MGDNIDEYLCRKIATFNVDDLDIIIEHVLRRYNELVPETEMVCLFLPQNDPDERKRILAQCVQFLESHQNYAKN